MNNLRKNGWSLDQKGSGGVAFLEDSGRSGAPGATTLCKCDRIPHVMYAKAQKSRIGLAATGALLCASLLSTGSASAERLVTTRNPRVVKGEFGAKSASQRITGVRYPDGVVELYKLRPDGTRLGLKSVVGMPSGVPLGPDAFADTVGTLSKHVEYSIDARDGLSGIQDLVSGEIGTVAQDAAGRMTTFEFDGVSRTMTWDAADRLVGIVQNGQTSSYTYDYRGWRTSKATPGESVTYTWGADDLVAEEATTADGTLPVRTYLQGPRMGLVLGIAEGSTAQLFAHDALGSATARVQPQTGGVTTALHRYDAWGAMREVPGLYAVRGVGVNQVGYTGHGFDVESGLVYAKARYLDPAFGRFLTTDPEPGVLDDPLSLRGACYAKCSPTRYTDENGRHASAVLGVPGVPVSELVHQMALDIVFERINAELRQQHKQQVSPWWIQILKDETVRADEQQENGDQWAHAMYGADENVPSSEREGLRFIAILTANERTVNWMHLARLQYSAARDGPRDGPRRFRPDDRQAYHTLGPAMHLLQDATSRAHVGFQRFSKKWDKYTMGERHGQYERNYPAGIRREALEGATEWGYRMMVGDADIPGQFFSHQAGRLLLPARYGGHAMQAIEATWPPLW